MNQIEQLEDKIKRLQSFNDDFYYELKEVRDILSCIGYTDKNTFPEVILNAVDAVGKVLEEKMKILRKNNERVKISM